MEQEYLFLPYTGLTQLLECLQSEQYRCIGPRLRDGAIVYGELNSVAQLPRGVRQHQAPGQYRLQQTDEQSYFSWANGPQALKPYTFASEEILWECQQQASSLEFTTPGLTAQKLAFIGVRACDIAALYIQDRHFLQQDYRDPYYLARRQNLFLVAVNCTAPAATCFCASTGDGPQVSYGFDLALTELKNGFVLQFHSDPGRSIAQALQLSSASEQQIHLMQQHMQHSAEQQQRQLTQGDLSARLFANLHHPRWQDIAQRCLSCGNCTSVCPTCFCHHEFDHPNLEGERTQHIRQWDSCFNAGHSYIHGVTIRDTTAKRYRQWLTHKFGSWQQQYGRSGCVGCGRCISWCPVGIDVTEEIAQICGLE